MNHFLPRRRLSYAEAILIPEALIQLFIYRLRVSFRPSSEWMPKSSAGSSKLLTGDKREKVRLVAAVINGLADRTPWASTCLVKALAAAYMLNKREIPQKLHIGVARTPSKDFKAHAWLSVDGKIIVGGGNLEDFHEIS